MPHLADLLTYFRRRVGTPDGDGALLQRFTAGDGAAFDELLRRHGNLVYGVCRRVLRHQQDAEDAFQATFLVLARKARSLDGRDTLAGWLYTVARHIALRARAAAARRRDREQRGAEGRDMGTDTAAEVLRRELRPILDEEMGRLPDKYRAPLVLCYVEGKTNEEAALLLGWTKGTVSGRLARARDLLRGRLERRGLALPATAVAALVAEQATLDAAPAALLQLTAKAAALVAGGKALAAVAPAPVAALAQGAVRRLTVQRVWKWAAASLLFACLVGIAAVLYHGWRPQSELALPAPDDAADRMPAPRPAVVVRVAYPGASAQMVAEVVAGPIEREVAGVEGAVHMLSQSGNDGSYTLTITFQAGTNLDLAQVLVQNRVALALPALPPGVETGNITVAKLTLPLLLVALSAPTGERDQLYLSNLATLEVVPELRRAAGVADVALIGRREVGVSVWLDPDKLAARKLTPLDVVRALKEARTGKPAGKEDPAKLGEIVVKVGGGGEVVYLKDLARVEQAADAPLNQAVLNGKPVVLLSVEAIVGTRPAEVAAAVRAKVATLQARLPAGVRLEVVCGLSATAEGGLAETDYLWLDAVLPSSASTERSLGLVEKLGKRLKEVRGVDDVLALTGPPFATLSNQGSLLVRLAPADKRPPRAQVIRAVRQAMAEELAALLLLRELRGPGALTPAAYPVQAAVSGPDGAKAFELATALVLRLRALKMTDLFAGPDRFAPQVYLDFNREEAKKQGVKLADILATFQVCLGGVEVGGGVQVLLPPDEFRRGDVTVPDADGKPVPLRGLVEMRDGTGPPVLERLNGHEMVTVTGNPPPGVSLAETRKLCEMAFAAVRAELALPEAYRLTWLRVLPPAR
jgi:RNA polymerase sigma factor (sigma-70 family)